MNYSKIARDIGVDTTTVQNYYSILDETLVGFFLPAFHRSVRKRQMSAPKFYLFDTGVSRALDKTLDIPLSPRTYEYGKAFEHFIILEFIKLAEYGRKDWEFSYLRTKDGAEIDLIVKRPGQKTLCIEIKSSEQTKSEDIKSLKQLGGDIPDSKLYCLSLDSRSRNTDGIHWRHWQEGIKEIFFST